MRIMDSSRRSKAFTLDETPALIRKSGIKGNDERVNKFKSICNIERVKVRYDDSFYWLLIYGGCSGQKNIPTICFRQLNSIMACHLCKKWKCQSYSWKKTMEISVFLSNPWYSSKENQWIYQYFWRNVNFFWTNPWKVYFFWTNPWREKWTKSLEIYWRLELRLHFPTSQTGNVQMM